MATRHAHHHHHPSDPSTSQFTTTASTVRRNLFHAHLSRRPASSTSNGTTHSSSSASTLHAATTAASSANNPFNGPSHGPTGSRNAFAASSRPPSSNATSNAQATSIDENPFASEIVPRDLKTGLYIPLPSTRSNTASVTNSANLSPEYLDSSHHLDPTSSRSAQAYHQHHHHLSHSRGTSHSSATTIHPHPSSRNTQFPAPFPPDLATFETSLQRSQREAAKSDSSIRELMEAYRQRRSAPPPSRGALVHGGTVNIGEGESLEAYEAELLSMVKASLDARIAALEDDRWIFEGGEGGGGGVDP